MEQINMKELSERDICTKYITPAIQKAGWDLHTQIREEVTFTDGRVIVKGQSTSRGSPKRADYILYYKPNIPIAVIEAKNNKFDVGDGMQQALCDDLESKLNQSHADGAKLMEAVVHQFVVT